jgi:LysR family transcriptional regulator for metE and metH
MNKLHQTLNLELRDLRLVASIAQSGGLGAAARRLHLTQSALSHHLKALEERMGANFFDRVGRGLVLNARGARLVELAERLWPEVLAVERALSLPQTLPSKLRLTSGCYTAYPWLPEALRRLSAAVPGTRVEVVVDATRRAAEALLSGEVDLALMPWLTPDARLLARPVFEEEISAVMLPNDPLAKRATVPVSALATRRVLVHEVPPDELVWTRKVLGRSFSALRHAERVPLTEAMVALTKLGQGVSLLGPWAIRAEIERGELVSRPLRPRLRRPFALVSVRAAPADPRAEVLVEVLKEWGSSERTPAKRPPPRARRR